MRYLIYALIIANLAFFIGYPRHPLPDPDQRRLPPLPPDVDTLVLLSERGASAGSPIESADGTAVSTASAAHQQGPEPEPDIGETPPAVVTGPSEPAPVLICQTVGPFRERANAGEVAEQLQQQGYKPHLRDGKVREQAGYWVYLPAMPSQRAREIVTDLQAHGMKDYYVGKRNFISLGIFSDRNKAEIRQQRVQGLGYEAVLDPRFRNRKVYWLDLEEPGRPLADTPLWTEVYEKNPDITVQEVSCE